MLSLLLTGTTQATANALLEGDVAQVDIVTRNGLQGAKALTPMLAILNSS